MNEPDNVVDRKSLDAARIEAKRLRRMRDKLSKHVDVLDDVDGGVELPAAPSVNDVAAYFHVHRARIATLLWSYREEFLSDGWRPGDEPEGTGPDMWPAQAIVRAALLLDAEFDDEALHLERPGSKPSPVGAQIRFLLGRSPLPVEYSSSPGRARQCRVLHENAMRIVEHVHDDGAPSKLWAELQETERYELQALVVALAALVPVDQPGLTTWLKTLAGNNGDGAAVARGLMQLIPQPSSLYRRRFLGRTRLRNMNEHRAVRGA